MTWRPPVETDQGTEVLVQSDALIDEDFNVAGVCIGTITQGPRGFQAVCATWCDHQDHYHTTEIKLPFQVHPLPNVYGPGIVGEILRDVCELSDRDSPSEEPDLLLVSADELSTLLTRNLFET